MINSVTIYNDIGESITMELRRPELSGFLIHYIDGLGPSKANIEMTEMSLIDGSIFNSARSISRNLVFYLIFEGSDIEAIRKDTYKYFPLRKRITIEIETDSRTCETYGYVESNTPTIFSKREGTTISVRCPSSYLFSTTDTITIFNAIQPLFEFPFENASLTENLLEFASIEYDPTMSIFYEGDVNIGLIFMIHAIGPIDNISIWNLDTNELISIDTDRLAELTGEGFHGGDDIIISTIKGDKYAKLIRDGEETNIFNCLNKYPDWFQLRKGYNIFTYVAENGELNVEMTIQNQIIFEGI